MSKAQELLPCPFCSGVDSKHQADCYFTLHKRLQAESEFLDFSLAPAVIQAWNRRAASSDQQAAQQDAALLKPESGRYVLAWMEGREVPIRAMWVPSKWLLANDECPEDWAEYDESKDEYFCPEGWYEKNEHEEQNWFVSTPVVAWMELPRLAARASNGGKA